MQKVQKNINKIRLLYDTKERMIYTDMHNNHYIITEEKLQKYEFFHNRYLFSFTIAILLSIINLYLALGIGIASLIILEIRFRTSFLRTCDQIDEFVVHKTKNLPDKTKKENLILAVIYFLLGAILLYFTIINETSKELTYISYGIVLFAFFTGIKYLVSIFKK